MTFDQRLETYADLIVSVGANVQAGQRVVLQAPVEGAPLARLVTKKAYEAGAAYVDVLWSDDAVTLYEFQHAADETFDEMSAWLKVALNSAAERGDAFIGLRANDPSLLKDQDPGKVARSSKARRQALLPYMKAVTTSAANWCLVTLPLESWAAQVYPDVSPKTAVTQLWDAIFKATRADREDAAEAWQTHLQNLQKRRDYLTDKQYRSLHYRAPGTDLQVGLPPGHLWLGGTQNTLSGVTYVANLPTEEVFTLPHKDKVEGTVKSSMPLSYNGRLIDGFELTFGGGKVVSATAERGEETLHHLLETDAGARRLGEVALVPHSSPISQTGTLFYNTLYDENASCHLALGRAYAFTLEGGANLSDDEAAAAGVNHSLEHVDFMIGSGEMDIDGVTESGETEAVMRGGEWAFEAS